MCVLIVVIHLIFKKGIEIGNTFKLGTKYSECLDLNFNDTDNTSKTCSYGLLWHRNM